MGILCDPNFESGEIDNEKANDIIATVSFMDNAMAKFIENCVLQEIYDLSDMMSEQPEMGICKVEKLPSNKIVHWLVEDISYREKLKICKRIAPGLFDKHINKVFGEMAEIRNRVAHEWSRGSIIDQRTKDIFTKFFEDRNFYVEIKDIDDEYAVFQELYNKHRDFILTLEQKSSSEFLGLHE